MCFISLCSHNPYFIVLLQFEAFLCEKINQQLKLQNQIE